MTLAFILYALAENTDVQEKLRREVDGFFILYFKQRKKVDEAWEDAGGSVPDYLKIQGLSYWYFNLMYIF